MPPMPLTDKTIRSAKANTKPRRMFDGHGLYLEITPSGGKYWRLKYRFAGKEKRLALGVYPQISLKKARDRRDEARKLLADGIDPSQHRKSQKAATAALHRNSFELVAREWHAKQAPSWSDKHADTVIRRLETKIFPWLGKKPVSEITAPELLVVLRRIEDQGALETAHRVLSICSQVFRYAIATARAERDSAADLRGALPPVKPKHFAAVTEPDKIGPMLRAIDGYEGTLVVRCALRLAPLLFVRPGELRKAEWEGIDLESAEWRFTVTKTDTQHIVPLATQAVAILEELQPLTGGGRYVFPSARSPKRPMSDNTILAALRRMGIEKKEMSGHGFRAMARTVLDEELGFRPDYIEHQLAHSVRDPHGRAYNRTAHLAERKKMMQAWADFLDQLKETL